MRSTLAGTFTAVSPWIMTAIAWLTCAVSGRAQMAYFDFNNNTGTAATATTNTFDGVTSIQATSAQNNGTVTTPVNSSSASSGYGGASGTFNIGAAVPVGGFSSTTSPYIQFAFTGTLAAGSQIAGVDFGARSTGTGAQAFSIRSSVDNYASDLFTGAIANNSTWSFKSNSFTSALAFTSDTSDFALRIYLYGGAGNPTAGTINTRLDDVTIRSYAVPEPSSMILTAVGLAGPGWVAYRRRKGKNNAAEGTPVDEPTTTVAV